MLSIAHESYEQTTKKGAPSFAYSFYVKAFAIIDFKKDKYRVTLKSIKLHPRTISGGEIFHRITDLTALAKDGDHFNTKFFKSRSKVLNHTFLQIADFNKAVNDDNW